MGDAYRYVASFVGLERAEEWITDFYQKLYALETFPGLYANAKDEAVSERAGREMRRLLYKGSSKRPTGFAFKAFYYISSPAGDEPEGEVIVYSVVHGAADYPGDAAESEE